MSSRLKPFEVELLSALRSHGIGDRDTVLAAVSGGADSMAMLVALVAISRADGTRVVAAHLDHMLRGPESTADAQFVEASCARMNVRCVTRNVDVLGVARARGKNVEAVARDVRYGFLADVARESGIGTVLTAHTADDQAETVLMRLARGSGIDGLAGIASERPLIDGVVRVVRPLLGFSRSAVLAYCEAKDVDYRTDATNFDVNQSRALVRHELLPMIERMSAGAGRNIARLAALAASDSAYMTGIARDIIAKWDIDKTDGTIELPLKGLEALPPSIRRRVIRESVRRAQGDLRRIDASHVESIDSLLFKGDLKAAIDLPAGLRVQSDGTSLRFVLAKSLDGTNSVEKG